MRQKQKQDFQGAINAMNVDLSFRNHKVKKPIPFKWKKKIPSKFIDEAIREGRE